ncbi:MAG: response regulator [Nitrospirota bacterium]
MNNGPFKVLIVDDEPWNLEVLEAFFEGTGYEIIRAASGEEALSILNIRRVNVVLLDVMMPGMDGYGVCKKIKNQERTRDIPVVMVTSLDCKSAKIVAATDGADGFITKPIDKMELLAQVKSLFLHDQLKKNDLEIKALQLLEKNDLEIKALQLLNEDLARMLDEAKAKAFRPDPS